MRCINVTNAFKRDQKRVEKSNFRYAVKQRFMNAVKSLANDEPLDYSYHDHALTGNLLGHRECHISFDLVLIYRFEGDNILILERLGTHTEALGL